MSNFETYFPLAFQAFLAVVIGAVMFTVSAMLGKHSQSKAKGEAYECGIEVTDDTRHLIDAEAIAQMEAFRWDDALCASVC